MTPSTVAEAAALYHVSKQAVYGQLAKLSNKGKDKRTGLLTEEAVLLLESVYQDKATAASKVFQADLQIAMDKLQEKNDGLTAEIDRFRQQVHSMQLEIDKLNELLNLQKQANEVLTVKGESQQALIDALRSERDFLREQLAKTITPRLDAGDHQNATKKTGFLRRLLGGRSQ